ncbi:MAG TPA: glycosyltransferase family 39 protein [Pyrinomonadaceae bacterium]|nr:glycosyltransferase family 39 protein [Pyrinomonadaceae bacterium]
MNGFLIFLCLLVGALIVLAVPSMAASHAVDYGVQINAFYTGKAFLLCVPFAAVAAWYAYRQEQHGVFLLKIFITALLIRLIVASLIFANYGQEFFGGDAFTYDFLGQSQLQAWAGDSYAQLFVGNRMSGWGMSYFVGGIYALIGRNMLSIQFMNAVMGALTAIVVFICAQEVFTNTRVSKLAAIAIAFYPSLILWSSQGLKDGPIVFLLTLVILATLKLGQKFTAKYVIVLICALVCLLSLRFYIFYMITAAVGAALVIGNRQFSAISFIRQFAILVVLAVALTYVGVPKFASEQFETFGSLEKVDRSRRDMARRGDSGYGQDADVSTVDGAISNVPLGMLYLLFAPFPWQLTSLRQAITLPEMLIWWASFPMMILGLWFSLRYRLKMIAPIVIFTTLLSIAYSVFQGNVGTAYRQRAQLLVFYFIFVAVGYVVVIEKREDKKRRQFSPPVMSPGLSLSITERRP